MTNYVNAWTGWHGHLFLQECDRWWQLDNPGEALQRRIH